MDGHKESSAVASVAQEHGAAVPALGTIGTRPCALDQRLRTRPSKATHGIVLSAAGPWGDGLSRYGTTKGDDCWVVAPSLLPTKAGDRVKTDRRAAGHLARLARSGELTAVDVPQVAEDALRDLTRAREETRRALKDATFRLTACVLRPARRATGRAHGHPAHLRGLAAGVWHTPAQPSVLQADVRAVRAPTERLQRLEQARQAQGKSGRLHPVVEALQALRGVHWTGAVILVADRGALRRCAPPRARMQCLGLTPAAYAAGERRHQGSIT